MFTQVQNKLTYIRLVKDDIRSAIEARGGNLTGVPFDQWGTVIRAMSFGIAPISPMPAPRLPETISPINTPPNYDPATDGLTPISVAFAYGVLQFDFTGEEGSIEVVIQKNFMWLTDSRYLGDWTLKTVEDCIYAVKAVIGKLIAFDFNNTPGLYDGTGGYINYIGETNNDNRIQQWVDLAESRGCVITPVAGFSGSGFNLIETSKNNYQNIEIGASYGDDYFTIVFYWGKGES
jgi:hypothetical protein